MRIGVNAVPLRVSGGGSRYVFTGLMDRLFALDEQNEYVIFTHFLGLGVVNQLAGVHAHLGLDGSRRPRVRVVEVDCEESILHHWHEFDLFFGPLNNLQPRIYDRPSVAILHDIQEQYFPEYFSEADLLARREIYPEICRASTTLVTVSEFCKRSMVEKFGIEPEKVEVVYNAPQAGLVDRDPDDQGVWRREPLPDRYLFYPANCYPHKNHRLLLDALVRLRGEGRDIPAAVFCGFELPGGFALRSEIARRGLSEHCRVFEEVEVDELRYLYRHALALVVPTLFEGFCMPAVEAMACGCPVVCSDLPALREVAGEHALYFEPDHLERLCERIERVATDGALRDELTRGGRLTAQRFSWDKSAERMLDIFRQAPGRFYGLDRGSSATAAAAMPRIGVLITGTRGAHGVPEAVKNVLATGYSNTAMRVLLSDAQDNRHIEELLNRAGIRHDPLRAGETAGWAHLRQFADEERLDLVGELLAGYNALLPTALHSLARAHRHEPNKAVYLGEAWENRDGGRTCSARLRQMGDGLWKLEGFLYPEMMFLSSQRMARWQAAEGATGDVRLWRWALLKEAHRAGQLCLMRRTLAACDRSCVSIAARYWALQEGVQAVYQHNGEPHRGRWLYLLKPLLRPASRILPAAMRAKGKRAWQHLTGER